MAKGKGKRARDRLPDGTPIPLYVLSRSKVVGACARLGIRSLMELNLLTGDAPGYVYQILNKPGVQGDTWSRYAAALRVPLPELLEPLQDVQRREAEAEAARRAAVQEPENSEGTGDLPDAAG